VLVLNQTYSDSFSGQVTFIFELMDMSLYDHLKARNNDHSKPRWKQF